MSALGSLVVKLALDYAEYTQGLDRSDQQSMRFAQNAQEHFDQAGAAASEFMGRVVKTAAGAVVALVGLTAVINGVGASIDTLAKLDDAVQKTGASVENLSRIQQTAAALGQSFDEVDGVIVKLAKGMATADGESNKVHKALKALGVEAKDAAGKLRDPSVVLVEATKALQGFEDGANKSALATDLLGKEGAEALPFLNDLAENVDRFAGVSKEAAQKASELQDRLGFMRVKSDELYMAVALALLPSMADLAGAVLDTVNATGDLETTGAVAWADDLAVGVARVVDVAILLPKIFSGVVGSFKVVAADVKLAMEVAENANPITAAKKYLAGGSATEDIKRALAERNKVLEAANKEYDDLWNKSADATEKGMLKRIAERTAAVAAAAGDPPKRELNYTTGTDADAGRRADAIRDEQEAYAALTASINEKLAASSREAAGLAPLTAAQKLQINLDEQLASGKLKLTKEHQASIEQKIREIGVSDEVIASQKLARAGAEAWERIQKANNEAVEKSIENAVVEADKNEDLARTFGMTKAEIEELELARLQEQLAQRASVGMTIDEISNLERLIEAKKRSAAAMTSMDEMRKQKEVWESIEKTAHDTFISIFDSGKSAFDRLKDTLKNGLLDLLYQMTIKKWIFNISANVSGGDSGFSGADSGGGASMGSVMNLISMGKTLYAGFSGAFATGIGTMAAQFGTMIGSSTLTAFGSGMAGTMLGSSAGMGATVAGSATGIGSAGAASAAGSTVASAIPIVGWVIAAMATANALYKKGWDSTNGTMSKFGTAVGSASLILDKFHRALGMSNTGANLWSGQSTVSRLFGRKNPEVESFGIEGAFGAGGFDGQVYQNILEKGGTFRSDKRYGATAALDSGVELSLDDTIKNLILSVQGFGAQMGIEADHISNYTKAIKLELTKDEAKNQELIAKLFGDIGNELATALVPSIAKLGKEGEVAATTLARLTTNYAAVDAILFSLGTTFGAVGLDSLKARERLIDLSGGIDNLANDAAFFAQNFMSEAERAAPAIKSVKDQMAAMGLSSVTTHEQFKNVVLGLDKTTEAGATQYVAMMRLMGPFHEVTTYLAQLAAEAAAAAPVVESAADAITRIQQAARSSADSLLSGVDAAFGVLQRVVDREKAARASAHAEEMRAIQARLDASTASVASAKERAGVLAGALDTKMPGREAEDRTSAQAQLKTALAIARMGGPLPATESLKGILGSLSKDASSQFSSVEEYERDFYQTRNNIAELGKFADDALSVEEQTLAALVDQKDAAELAFVAEMTRLDNILIEAQLQLDALKGIDTTLLTMEQGLQGFGASLLAANANPILAATGAINTSYQSALGRAPEAAGLKYWQDAAAGGMSPDEIANLIKNSPEAQAQSLFQSILGRTGDAAGIDYWTKALSSGLSIDSARDMFKRSDEYKRRQGIPGFVRGGDHMGGLRLVGEAGPEIEDTGASRIHSTQDLMDSLRNPSSNNDALVAEVRALREEVIALRTANSNENYAIAKYGMSTADFLDAAVNGEKPILVKVEA